MYLIERQKKILTLLLAQNGWITGAQIGKKLQITDRTVRKDIRDMNESLKKYPGTLIESVRGQGYLLRTRHKNELLGEVGRVNINETPQGRISNLALEIFQEDEPLSLEDLEEEYYISRTTLEAAIRQINERCTASGAGPVVQHKKNAVQAECGERTRRELMRSFLLLTKEKLGQKIQDDSAFLEPARVEMIMQQIRKTLAACKMKITDLDMAEAVVWLYIQQERMEFGHFLEPGEGKADGETPPALRKITEMLVECMEEQFAVCYPKEEKEALAEYLANIRLMKEERFTKSELASFLEPRYIVIVEELLNDIKSRFMIDFTEDEMLFVDLALHIRFSIRPKSGEGAQEASLLHTIKNKYPFVFELSTYIFGRIYDVFGIEMNEVQLSYVAAHLGAALERLENTRSSSDFRVAVCSNLSMGIVKLLMAKLNSMYKSQVNITGPFAVYEMEQMLQERPDLILTTTLYGMFEHSKVPVLAISPMLETDDVAAINQKIKQLRRNSVIFPLEQGLEQYFEEDLFFPQLKASSRNEVLTFLTDKIVEKGYAPANLLEDILEREKIAPTTFSNQMAMPHPIHMCAYKTVIAVATLEKSVLWGKQNVRLVFMLIVRSSDMKYINGFFDITSSLASQKKKAAQLIEMEDFQSFMEGILPM